MKMKEIKREKEVKIIKHNNSTRKLKERGKERLTRKKARTKKREKRDRK
jgi:hypothetical protein